MSARPRPISLAFIIFILYYISRAYKIETIYNNRDCDLVDALHDFPMVPAKTFLRSTWKSIIFTLIVWLGCRYPLQLLTCHDHATLLYNSFFETIFFSTLDLEIILSRKKNRVSSRRFQAPPESIGKRVKDLVTENLRESGMFPTHSFSLLDLLQFLYASFERQYKFAHIELRIESG